MQGSYRKLSLQMSLVLRNIVDCQECFNCQQDRAVHLEIFLSTDSCINPMKLKDRIAHG